MAVFACTKCGWVRRSPVHSEETRCPVCGHAACSLTPTGELERGGARGAAAGGRVLHEAEPARVPVAPDS